MNMFNPDYECSQDFKDRCKANNDLVISSMDGIKSTGNLHEDATGLVKKFSEEGYQVFDYQLIIKIDKEPDSAKVNRLTIGYKLSVIDYFGHTNQYGDYITILHDDFTVETLVPIARKIGIDYTDNNGKFHCDYIYEDNLDEYKKNIQDSNPGVIINVHLNSGFKLNPK